jgi:hypothetical protein
MCENFAFFDTDQHNTIAEDTNQGNAINRKNQVEDKEIRTRMLTISKQVVHILVLHAKGKNAADHIYGYR